MCAYLSVWDGAAWGLWVKVKASLPWSSFKGNFPFTVITKLLTIFSILYNTSLSQSYYTNSLYLPLTHPHIAPHSPTHRRRQQQPTPALLPGKSHGQRSLVGYSPWGSKELDTTEWLHFHFSLSCTGDGNGNPLQYSCLENPRDGGAWWAAVYGITQTQTQLTRLSSSRTHPHIAPLPHW